MDVRGSTVGGGLTVHRDGTVLRAVLHGAVDMLVRERDSPALFAALRDPATRAVEVDAAAVTFLDSSGLSVLVRLARDAAERGVPLRLVAVSPRVAELLAATGVDEWMAGIVVHEVG